MDRGANLCRCEVIRSKRWCNTTSRGPGSSYLNGYPLASVSHLPLMPQSSLFTPCSTEKSNGGAGKHRQYVFGGSLGIQLANKNTTGLYRRLLLLLLPDPDLSHRYHALANRCHIGNMDSSCGFRNCHTRPRSGRQAERPQYKHLGSLRCRCDVASASGPPCLDRLLSTFQ